MARLVTSATFVNCVELYSGKTGHFCYPSVNCIELSAVVTTEVKHLINPLLQCYWQPPSTTGLLYTLPNTGEHIQEYWSQPQWQETNWNILLLFLAELVKGVEKNVTRSKFERTICPRRLSVLFTVCSTHEYYKLWKGQPARTNGSPSRAISVLWKYSFFSPLFQGTK